MEATKEISVNKVKLGATIYLSDLSFNEYFVRHTYDQSTKRYWLKAFNGSKVRVPHLDRYYTSNMVVYIPQ